MRDAPDPVFRSPAAVFEEIHVRHDRIGTSRLLALFTCAASLVDLIATVMLSHHLDSCDCAARRSMSSGLYHDGIRHGIWSEATTSISGQQVP